MLSVLFLIKYKSVLFVILKGIHNIWYDNNESIKVLVFKHFT